MTEKLTLDQSMREQIAINEGDIVSELVEQASRQFYWGSMWAKALKQEKAAKVALEALEAELAKKFRESSQTHVTEKIIKEHVTSHPEYLEAYNKYIQLGYMADLFGVCKGAFESRSRLLLELARQHTEGKFYQAEYQNMREEFERRVEDRAKQKKTRKPTGNPQLILSEQIEKENT